MRVLILEYITGGGLIKESLPESLAFEGNLMLLSLMRDLIEIPGVSAIVTRDARLKKLEMYQYQADVNFVYIERTDDFNCVWTRLMQEVDAVWPIAPETNRILESICFDVEKAGKILLNSPHDVVRITASKLKTAHHLQQHKIPIVPTFALNCMPEKFDGPWVVKPDDGIGCEGSRIVHSRKQLEKRLADTLAKGLIIQPLVSGQPISLSILFDQGTATLLSCNRQRVAIVDDCFSLHACIVNDIDDSDGNYQHLSNKIASALPGLWAYVGIDLMLTDKGPLVLEINPRLTTSYAGLRPSIGVNTAAIILKFLNPEQRESILIPHSKKSVELTLDAEYAY